MVKRSRSVPSGTRFTPQKAGTDGVVVNSHDGQLSFRLQPIRHGLWVQRERLRQDSRARLIQTVVFTSAAEFSQWCAADRTRFDYPLVASALVRAGQELLQRHGP